jgi:hypothetical protein
MDKKMLAKMMMLQKLKGDTTNEMHKGLGDGLAKTKKMKVVIEAPDAKGIKEGLSKAKQIMAMKLGMDPSMLGEAPEMEDAEEMDAESGLELSDMMEDDADEEEEAEDEEDLEDLA